MWKNGTLIIAGENTECLSKWKSWANSYKVKYTLTINPAISLFGIYPREVKTYAHLQTSVQIFIAAIQNDPKQPKCPSGGEHRDTLQCTCAMGYYSAMREANDRDTTG